MTWPTFDSLENLRDPGLFLFRAVAGGAFLFCGAAALATGRAAWIDLGVAVGIAGAPAASLVAGLAVAVLTFTGGALLVLGAWTRLAALGLGVMMAGAALLRWPAVLSGTLEAAVAFFYPLSLAAALGALATTGGGRFGLDAVRRERLKKRRR